MLELKCRSTGVYENRRSVECETHLIQRLYTPFVTQWFEGLAYSFMVLVPVRVIETSGSSECLGDPCFRGDLGVHGSIRILSSRWSTTYLLLEKKCAKEGGIHITHSRLLR